MAKVIVSLSGGMDSTTVLYEAIHQVGVKNVMAVSFDYGSKHNKQENIRAAEVARHAGVLHYPRKMNNIFANSALLAGNGRDIPEGHYEQSNMSQTVVPGRNTVMTSILMGLAEAEGYDQVWVGVHGGDHAIYPDCRPMWFYSMAALMAAATEEKVTLQAPFLYGDKTSIIARGLELGVPYKLTHTCYKGGKVACGRCGACQERLEAFRNNNMEDPIEYEFRGILPKED